MQTNKTVQGHSTVAEIIVPHGFKVDLGRAFAVATSIISAGANGAVGNLLVCLNWVCYLSLFAASACELYVMGRCFSRYRQLFETMQSGRHDYVGRTLRKDLGQGFAETTMFPGMLFGTTFFGFLFVSIVTFIILVAVALLMLPAFINVPYVQTIWQHTAPVLLYLTLAFLLREFISFVIMDMLLVEEGEVTYPALFSLFWFIELFLNFILGVSFSVFRSGLVLVWAVVSCCFLDFTLLPEALCSWDSAYYSLLTMAYTHHVRRNPIKKAMVTAVFRHVESLQSRAANQELSRQRTVTESESGNGRPDAAGITTGLRRARARFYLALTLHHNPELRHLRQRVVDQDAQGPGRPRRETMTINVD